MTRDAEHTPSPQSVVVPVEPTEAMLRAMCVAIENTPLEDSEAKIKDGYDPWLPCVRAAHSAMLAAAPAPAPSSLAGGALDPQSVTLEWVKVETRALEEWRAEFGDYIALATLGHDNDWTHRVNNSGRMGYKSADEAKAAALADLQGRLSIRLHAARKTVALYDAALSPEAPAREVGAHSVAVGRLTWAANTHPDPEKRALLTGWAEECQAALTPRHEAPAEGAGGADLVDWFSQFIDRYVEETNGPDGEALIACLDRVRDSYRQQALRARSSAPEAREGERPYGWIYEKQDFGPGWCAGLEWHPAQFTKTAPKPERSRNIIALYTTPRRPEQIAERLREAASLLDDCIWLDHDTGDYRVEHDGSVERARAILAALSTPDALKGDAK